jgi:hypothetical protein
MGAESQKAPIIFFMSARLFLCNSAGPTWRISVEFGIWDLDENLSKKSQIWLNSSTSHVDRNTLYCCRRHYIAIKPLSLSRRGKNITRTRHSVTLPVNCPSFWTQDENLQLCIYLLYHGCLPACLPACLLDCLSVCPRLNNRWPLKEFLLNNILRNFTKFS